uniref:Uncharacterized protein n=1 Tax=Arundo donax TaxID=35708 RepID=A0A0A9D8Y2_ARUDO
MLGSFSHLTSPSSTRLTSPSKARPALLGCLVLALFSTPFLSFSSKLLGHSWNPTVGRSIWVARCSIRMVTSSIEAPASLIKRARNSFQAIEDQFGGLGGRSSHRHSIG